MKKIALVFLVLVLLSITCIGTGKKEGKIVPINSWLFLGPAEVETNGNREKNIIEILNYKFVNISKLIPKKGETVSWNQTLDLKWKPLKDGLFRSNKNKILYFATYLKTNRWLKAKFIIKNFESNLKIYLNGKKIKAVKNRENIAAELNLTNEKHLLLIKVVVKKDKKFVFKPFLHLASPFDKAKIISSISSSHRVNIKNILNANNINSISLSKNGKFVKVGLNRVNPHTEKNMRWIEVLRVNDGKLLFSSKNIGNISGFQWLKSSGKFSYLIDNKELSSIYIDDLNKNSQRLVLSDIKNFSTYWWSPDNKYFIYSTSKIFDKNKGFNHIKELPLRAINSGNKSALHIVYINKSREGLSSVSHKLADYKDNYNMVLISPNSKNVIVSRFINDYSHRPYQKLSASLLNLSSRKIKKLISSYWIKSIVWSPDSEKLLMTGGPSSFNNIGNALPKNTTPNDFDGQMFLFDLKTKQPRQLSKNFNPSIGSVYWKQKNTIYLSATDKSYSRIYKYNIKKKKFVKLKTKVDVVRAFDISKNTAVYSGSSTTKSPKLYKVNLSSKSVSILKDYDKSMFNNVIFGQCKDWDFKAQSNRIIKGRLYYPPNFNRAKKYPCIVYYYGGTSPVTREFGGRYPKNWYAANGYIVYVPQPTGTVGFGQESSSVHVNDWGKITSQEIIEGIKKLTKEHPYIDSKRIGSMGASYGGFLTQYLATQTDKIAAFISHAGISALASYWGIGEWGYLYSGVASANSFPWNRKDLYIGHSPLYMVDRIKNPILLLHGDSDNNVPPGESYQMYAALKLAGKEAELITFKGQKHFILEHKKRIRWMRTIIAWFDKWLKAEPEHWQEMYKK